MPDIGSAIWIKVLSMFLVMAAGWLARRRGWFSEEATGAAGRLILDIAFPALTFTQMVRTVDGASLTAGMPLCVTAIVILVLAHGVGWGVSRLFPAAHRPSFIFLAGMPNWIFLPLAIVPTVVGDAGIRAVLLFNIPAQVFLWTAGVWVLRGQLRGAHCARQLFLNPGLLATLAGILLALFAPGLARSASPGWVTVRDALEMIGGLTVPLSLVVTGAQLGSIRLRYAFPASLWGLLAARLVLAPVLTLVWLKLASPLDPTMTKTAGVIACMPVAVSCSLFIERFGGDRDLAASAITLSTALSLVTLPLMLAWFL